jgi:hypothetical protein
MQRFLRAVRWLSLGGWLGSWALFALVIAPTAFRVLPSGDIAGALVSPVLRTLHLYGVLAGAVLFAIAFALRERGLLLARRRAASCGAETTRGLKRSNPEGRFPWLSRGPWCILRCSITISLSLSGT